MTQLVIKFGDNLPLLRQLPDASIDLIYIDPPFNTGRVQTRVTLSTKRDPEGDRTGYKGQRYTTEKVGEISYADSFDDYMAFLAPRLTEAYRLLSPQGSLLLHLDYREVHYAKVWLDGLFGRNCFQNEIIWAYDYGARTKKRWPAKHDNILWYSRHPTKFTFNIDDCDRIPYMAPGLVGPKKAARGKLPTDTWWHTIVSPTGKEKTGYPSQKPRGIIDRLIKVHSSKGDTVLDFFAGSGTTGASAHDHGRNCILMDANPEAMRVMKTRFHDKKVEWHHWPELDDPPVAPEAVTDQTEA